MSTHRYATALTWSGSTGVGYEGYRRSHEVVRAGGEGGARLTVSGDPAFGGDPALTNPEELLLAAASSCQLLSFLAVAARARLDVTGYTDDAEAVMPEDDPPLRITRVTLRPRVTIASDGRAAEDLVGRVTHLLEVAHRECFVARSLACEVMLEPVVHVLPGSPGRVLGTPPPGGALSPGSRPTGGFG